MSSRNSNIINNLLYAFGAQGISLLLSILMSLVVPKILGVEEYSYWQLFIFYSGYVGLFTFGLIDGIYLRLGGKKYKELNYSLLGTQFRLSFIAQIFISILVIVVALIKGSDSSRIFVLVATALYMIINNGAVFLGYIFQSVNQTRYYSLSIIIDRVIFILIVLGSLICNVKIFQYFVILYIASKMCCFIYCMFRGKEIVFAKHCSYLDAIKELKTNILVGCNLLIANIASMLTLGVGRLIIDNVWGITAFGKFSFALSMTNFFLQFITQVSMVLFPALRQVNFQKQKEFYKSARNLLSIVLPIIFLFYIPIKWLLGIWLPQYQESLKYLALLLPICTFDGKMQMLCNTFFKVMRKEKLLLKINILTAFLSLLLSLIGVYVFNSIYMIIIFMVVAVAFRSILSEIFLSSMMDNKIDKSLIQEILLTVVFMLSSWYLNTVFATIVFSLCYILFLIINRDSVNILFVNIKQKLVNNLKIIPKKL